ncbi:hypothetical protein D9M72_466280 [compost metagenome]
MSGLPFQSSRLYRWKLTATQVFFHDRSRPPQPSETVLHPARFGHPADLPAGAVRLRPFRLRRLGAPCRSRHRSKRQQRPFRLARHCALGVPRFPQQRLLRPLVGGAEGLGTTDLHVARSCPADTGHGRRQSFGECGAATAPQHRHRLCSRPGWPPATGQSCSQGARATARRSRSRLQGKPQRAGLPLA